MAGRFSLEAIFTARDRATRVFGRVYGAMERFQRSTAVGLKAVDKINGKILDGLSSIASKAKTAALVVGGMAAGALVAVGKTGSDFEQAIANVGAVSLMTRDQIADLEKKALELGSSTKFTATEVAGAMELMGKAGFSNAEILQGIGGILSAAAAEGAGIEEIAGHVSNVLKGMGLATDQAGRVADVLTLASARTNSSISSLGESMANVASTARQLNVPLEDTVAAVAMLQDVGLDASVAGSALNTMLTALAKPSDEVAAKMRQWGVSFKDAKGNMLPFEKVLEQLNKAAEKSGGNFDQVAFFAELVGLRGQKAAANLKDLFKEGKLQGLTKELQGAAGSAEKMAGLRMQTFQGDLTKLKAAIDSVSIALFDTQAGPLREIVQGITSWVNANKELIASKFVEYVQLSLDVADAFVDGVKDGFEAVKPAIDGVLSGFEFLFGGSGEGPRIAAYIWGKRITELAFAFLAWTMAVKIARGAIIAYGIAAKGVGLIFDGIRGAIKLARLILVSETGAKVINTIATWANQAATVAAEAATVTLSQARGLATGATGLYTGATVAATGATEAAAGAATTANAAFLPLLATLGAVAAAFAAVYVAWKQNESLKKETEGLGFMDILGGTLDQASKDPFSLKSWDPFAVVDKHQNKLARQRAIAEGRMDPTGRWYTDEEIAAHKAGGTAYTPEAQPGNMPDASSRADAENMAKLLELVSKGGGLQQLEISIKDQTGKAEVTKAPKGGKGISVKPSGDM